MADKPETTKKRRVKNPETFRERATKAAQTPEKIGIFKRIRSAIARVLLPIFRPIGRFFSKLFNVQPFKSVKLAFHWIGLVVVPPYFRNSWRELKLVTWPNWKESRSLTFAVLVFAVVFGAAVALVDYGLDKLFRNVLLK